MIVDTDVLIWYFRGNEHARDFLLDAKPFSISCITLMELLQGARDKHEQSAIKKQLDVWNTEIVFITEADSVRAVQLVNDYALSHGISIADAQIAATALSKNTALCTANTKHFNFIAMLVLHEFSPMVS